jgi:2-oxoglutarate/2-oxoacid ferredoxin oxidoreductase subunit alpha
MATAVLGTAPASSVVKERGTVNDFSIVAATVNGSGSQTANITLIRALFHMGIPVNGKNLFPSNIEGLPTWYTIRVSKDGYVARREGTEILIAFNDATVVQDLAALPPGGVCFYSDELKFFNRNRDDVVYYQLPVKDISKEALDKGVASGAIKKEDRGKFKGRLACMVYVGVAAELLGIEMAMIQRALEINFKGRAKPVQMNLDIVQQSALWARENLTKQDPYRVERMNETEGLILIEGNTASALGAIYGGLTVAAWYPITPATSLADSLEEYMPKLRKTEDGQATYSIIQAEDEIAAIGMVLGAGWAGARAMTSTSGPGISLMSEFAGFGYYTEIPGVIWDIQRMGPSTGLPTRVSQGDIISTYFLGHGDTRHVILFPGSVAECFTFGHEALNLAERLQTPVFVLSDLDLGMNFWMSEPFEYPDKPIDRGKVLGPDELSRIGTAWGRYKDVDGDGIPYRTIPGTEHPNAAYFTRGSGHNEFALYSERGDDWVKNMARLARKHDTARTLVPAPVVDVNPQARIGIIAVGSTDPAIVEARDRLRQQEVETSYLRLRALPLTEEVRDFVAAHDKVYVVEMNGVGQLCLILRMELPDLADRLVSVAYADGLPLTARFVAGRILAHEQPNE